MTAFLDTNVLLYSISDRPGERAKAERAQALVDKGGFALSMQVLQEFYWQATKPNRQWALPPETARRMIETWRRFPVQETTLKLLDLGFAIQARHRFSFWDSMILAAARAQGCDVVWTEDMDDGRIVEGMRVANPFR
ncbi:MAG TPA: PIN domain-containing protein [Allosphingosinicella sp.]|nr:PIN domain-containing protein [Allosphingosinicella sp.]